MFTARNEPPPQPTPEASTPSGVLVVKLRHKALKPAILRRLAEKSQWPPPGGLPEKIGLKPGGAGEEVGTWTAATAAATVKTASIPIRRTAAR